MLKTFIGALITSKSFIFYSDRNSGDLCAVKYDKSVWLSVRLAKKSKEVRILCPKFHLHRG